jgi:alkaline phosphatase
MEQDIAVQQLYGYNNTGRRVDLMFGGGACYFHPASSNTSSSCRTDERDLFSEAKEQGWTVIHNRTDFDDLSESATLPLLALFTADHMAFDIDRRPQDEPSLAEMTLKALRILDAQLIEQQKNQEGDFGFFLLVEGSRIDMAAHANDPAAHVKDILAYNEAVQVAQKYIDTHPGTILIAVSDHETGGLSVARELPGSHADYLWRPEALQNVTASAEYATWELLNALWGIDDDLDGDKPIRKRKAIETTLEQQLGLSLSSDGHGVTSTELDVIATLSAQISRQSNTTKSSLKFNPSTRPPDALPLEFELANLVSRNAEVGWSTHGHSAVDVSLNIYGIGDAYLREFKTLRKRDGGAHDATEPPPRIANSLADFKQSYRFPLLATSFWSPPADQLHLDDRAFWSSTREILWNDRLVRRPKLLAGSQENTAVGRWVASYLGVELDVVVSEIARRKKRSLKVE